MFVNLDKYMQLRSILIQAKEIPGVLGKGSVKKNKRKKAKLRSLHIAYQAVRS